MKKFIGLLLVLCLFNFLSGLGGGGQDQVNFPDIYIDESVAPGGVGSLADPYSDFSEINWTTGGDNSIFDWYAGAEDASVTINLQEGEVWRETLTVATSGSATYPIIIQSYGSDADPIINAADLVTGWSSIAKEETGGIFASGFEDEVDAFTTDFTGETETNGTNSIQQAIKNTGDDAAKSLLSDDEGQAWFYKDFAGQSNVYVRFYFYIGANWNAGNGAGNLLAFLYNGGVAILRVYLLDTAGNAPYIACYLMAPGTWIVSIPGATLTKEQWYYMELRYKQDAAVGGAEIWLDGVSQGSNYTKDTSGNDVDHVRLGFVFPWNSPADDASDLYFDDVKVDTSYIGALSLGGDIYKATLNTECHRVFHDGTELTENDGNYATLGADEWDWFTNELYVNIEQNPTGETIEATQRENALTSSAAKTYITVDGIHLKYNNHASAEGVIYVANACDNWTIQNCTVEYGNTWGIDFVGTSNSTITQNTITYCLKGGIYAKNQLDTGCTYSYNTISNCGLSGFIVMVNSSTFSHNLIHTKDNISDNNAAADHGFYIDHFDDGGSSNTFEYNEVYGYDDAADEDSSIRVNGDSNIIRYNYFHDNNCVMTANATYGSCDDNEIYYNIFDTFLTPSDMEGIKDSIWYNNVFYGAGLRFINHGEQACSGNLVRNNAFYSTNKMLLQVNAGQDTGFVSNYNCFYDNAANLYHWTGVTSNFADWKTNSGEDANSLNTDPLWVDAANSDFRLLMASLCINAGTDVGLTRDYRGRSIRHAPDIGAYEDPTNVLFLTRLFNHIIDKRRENERN